MEIPELEIRVPSRGNRRLEALLSAANSDRRLHAWWYMQQVNADRRDMSDHSWVHIQIVVNIALRLFRLLNRGGVEPAMVTTHGMNVRDAEVVIAAGLILGIYPQYAAALGAIHLLIACVALSIVVHGLSGAPASRRMGLEPL